MHLSLKIVVMGICLAAAYSSLADDQNFSTSQETTVTVEPESSRQESVEEQDGDWLEAHESNGPEGTRGVPMQRMPLSQFGLVLVVLTTGGGLAALTKTDKISRQ